jgi:cell division protein FtsB
MARRNLSKTEVERREKYRRRILAILALTGALYILVPLFLGDMGILKYFRMLRNQHELANDIQTLKRQNETLQTEVESLRTDASRIEEIAREQLGLVKEGEVVYHFKSGSD